jgi:cell wall-associated NlpC family hydrolase/LysM repeat protein
VDVIRIKFLYYNYVLHKLKEVLQLKKNLFTAAATAGLVLTAFGASASAQENTYTVHPGDSLWKISHLNNVSIDHLKDWNHLSSDRIYVNQKLSLTYTVKSGDSLWELARSYGTTVSELKNLNGLTADLIRTGQQLNIPNSKSSTPASVSTTPNNTTYAVQRGDSLSVIGARVNLSVSQLKSMNHLTTDAIHEGQTLNVSGAQSSAATVSAPTAEKPMAKSDATVAENPVAKPNSTAAKTFAAKFNSTTTEKPAATSDSSPAEKTVATTDSTETKNTVANSNSATAEKPAAPANTSVAEKPAAPANTSVVEKPATPANTSVAEKPAAPSNSPAATKPVVKSDSDVAQKATATSASKVQAVIDEAKKYIGTPYRWGGNTPAGFDCSGFTKYVFNNEGISLPRTTGTQWDAATPVNSPSIGDLVFFETYKVGPSHVGIYLGNNKFISAASQGVVISDMTATYWKTRYLGARSPF